VCVVILLVSRLEAVWCFWKINLSHLQGRWVMQRWNKNTFCSPNCTVLLPSILTVAGTKNQTLLRKFVIFVSAIRSAKALLLISSDRLPISHHHYKTEELELLVLFGTVMNWSCQKLLQQRGALTLRERQSFSKAVLLFTYSNMWFIFNFEPPELLVHNSSYAQSLLYIWNK
jgi:hypothetical protein